MRVEELEGAKDEEEKEEESDVCSLSNQPVFDLIISTIADQYGIDEVLVGLSKYCHEQSDIYEPNGYGKWATLANKLSKLAKKMKKDLEDEEC